MRRRWGDSLVAHVRHSALRRARYKCSFPGCNTPFKTDEGVNVLDIAHIVPRYLGGESIPGNIIVLCPNHHRLVDHSPEKFDPETLRKMRDDHENLVESEFTFEEFEKRETILPTSSRLSLEGALKFWSQNKLSNDEEIWHKFFVENSHILALTLPGKALQFGNKCFVGGKNIFNRGGGVVDFLYTPKSCQGVTLFEIKTPQTKIVGSDYRNRCFAPSTDLSGSVVQALHYKRLALRDLDELVQGLNPKPSSITVQSAVIIGNRDSLCEDAYKRDSFELFVSALRDIQIITYDELFEKVSAVLEI